MPYKPFTGKLGWSSVRCQSFLDLTDAAPFPLPSFGSASPGAKIIDSQTAPDPDAEPTVVPPPREVRRSARKTTVSDDVAVVLGRSGAQRASAPKPRARDQSNERSGGEGVPPLLGGGIGSDLGSYGVHWDFPLATLTTSDSTASSLPRVSIQTRMKGPLRHVET